MFAKTHIKIPAFLFPNTSRSRIIDAGHLLVILKVCILDCVDIHDIYL